MGAELAAHKLGPGSSGPTQIVAELDAGSAGQRSNRVALDAYVAQLRRDPEVAEVGPAQPSSDGRAALIVVQPRHDPESPQAEELLRRLRADDNSQLAQVATLSVGGTTGFGEDFTDLVSGSMWKVLVFVALFSYLVLLLLLRSVLLR